MMDGVENKERTSHQLTINFPRVLYERFESICEEKGFRKDEVIRTMVDDFVESYIPETTETENPDQINAFSSENV
jgi:metal-responsive CopG/Arc/MetJ family transcriptional regulator